MSKIDELRSHPAFPGGLVTVLQELDGRIAALETKVAALEKPASDQSTTGVVDNN